MIPVVLSVAGSDCSGGAGIQADLKTVAALGGYAATVITAVTAQNTLGVHAIYPLSPQAVADQLDAVFSDLHPLAVKIGMIPHAACIRALVQALDTYRPAWVVCDPVMISTSGRRLMDKDTLAIMQKELFPRCTLITPNLHEAEHLCGHELMDIETMKPTARFLAQQYDTSVLLKGGHLNGRFMTDVLFDQTAQQTFCFTCEKIDSPNLHGTGCTLSSAIATLLADGHSLPEAVQQAKNYMSQAIERGRNLHIGQGNGPLGHF
ncbi:phosphomethylpyrimidine kinase [gut metagenome]|uniref:Phosphomethylpyrimidine kinase n=1 Tax=gut metagenome TaxID=749906 RepID=J9GI97_9ZZZZ